MLSALEQSLNELIRRHETLRTTFANQDGQAIQVIMPEYFLPLPVIDVSGQSDEIIQQLARKESQTPFNLATGPLLRAQLFHIDEQSHVLLLTTHHIILDSWSTDILLHDLTSLYQAHVQGTQTSLPTLPIQYADYALWQKQWLQGQVLQDHYLLATASRGRTRSEYTTFRSTTTNYANMGWHTANGYAPNTTASSTQNFKSAGRGHPVYDPVGCLPGRLHAFQRSDRFCDRHICCQSIPYGSGREELPRPLRQYTGLTHRSIRQSQFPSVAHASTRHDLASLCASGHPI